MCQTANISCRYIVLAAAVITFINIHRFFCALDPSFTLAWAKTVGHLLKPDGELITLIYLISDQGGPPYNNTAAYYQKVLETLGFKAVLMEDNELAIKPRKGRVARNSEGGRDAANNHLYEKRCSARLLCSL